MALNYTKKTINHFLKPQNIGKIAKPDGYAQIGNMVCGDQLDFFLKIGKGKIKDVKFLSFGCASNIATASLLTEKVKGLSIDQAKKYNWKQVVDELGGLPNQKIHCSVMAVQGLQKAIADYESKNEGAVKKVAGKKKPVVAKRTITKEKMVVTQKVKAKK
ncbi:MAG: iron-sulfur cluster assembly scaffold protein [Patescibacteria group bacterium]|jgi:nitrogen fixation NifU-like protein